MVSEKKLGQKRLMRCDGQVMDDAGFSSDEDSLQRHEDATEGKRATGSLQQ